MKKVPARRKGERGKGDSHQNWVTNLRVKRWNRVHQEIGLGHLSQGRLKSFAIQTTDYFHAVVRRGERNPPRAILVTRAEAWPWSSLGQPTPSGPILLSAWPVPGAADRHRDLSIEWVNRPQAEGELAGARASGNRG